MKVTLVVRRYFLLVEIGSVAIRISLGLGFKFSEIYNALIYFLS